MRIYQRQDYLKKLDRIHPYPAKFPIELALEYIQKYAQNGVILDPFCGSGTTLLAARELDKQAFGFDINYIACLISRAKLLDFDKVDLQTLREFRIYTSDFIQEYDNISHWFKPESIQALSHIKTSINDFSKHNEQYKIFLQLVFSSIINIASNQESDTRYASVEKRHINTQYIYDKFMEKLHNAIDIFAHLKFATNHTQTIFLHNAKLLSDILSNERVSLIFTSPPYPNTYDYYLYHKHRMLWLDFDVKFSMQNEIGSRREYSSLKLPKEKFNNDLLEIFTQCQRVLQDRGHIVLVMGDGKIQGEVYNAKDEISALAAQMAWRLIDYSYSELDKTSRSFMQSYRTKHKKEHILVFQKDENADR